MQSCRFFEFSPLASVGILKWELQTEKWARKKKRQKVGGGKRVELGEEEESGERSNDLYTYALKKLMCIFIRVFTYLCMCCQTFMSYKCKLHDAVESNVSIFKLI